MDDLQPHALFSETKFEKWSISQIDRRIFFFEVSSNNSFRGLKNSEAQESLYGQLWEDEEGLEFADVLVDLVRRRLLTSAGVRERVVDGPTTATSSSSRPICAVWLLALEAGRTCGIS